MESKRNEKQMFELILSFAQNDERIRIVTLEGSRTNITVPKDTYQDYDITFLVSDYPSFLISDDWLKVLGERIIMQKPDAMQLFPSDGPGFSYLMLFTDGNKMDLTIMPLTELESYLSSDGLIQVLLDKDQLIKKLTPTDSQFWIRKPPQAYFNDCCNEFWWVSCYVVKGLLRREILYASWHLEQVLRPQLFNMLAWSIGADHGYNKFSIGKHCKYIEKYISISDWQELLLTYRLDSIVNCRQALISLQKLFRKHSKHLAIKLGYLYPDYDEKVSAYLEEQGIGILL